MENSTINLNGLTYHQQGIARELSNRYDFIDEEGAIGYINSIYGSFAKTEDIIIAFKYAFDESDNY